MTEVRGFDIESHPIRPGLLAPRTVCLSWARPDSHGPITTGLVLRPEGIRLLRSWMESSFILTGHNLTFDFGCVVADEPSLLRLVFEHYRQGLVECTMTRQMLLDVALGMREYRRARGRATRATYGLDDLVELYFQRHLEKLDTWRLRYGLLDGVPVEEWPQEARDYAIQDSVEAVYVRAAQSEAMREYFGGELPNQVEQQQAAWALHLMSMWGIRAEASAVDRFVANCQAEIDKMHTVIAEVEAEEADAAKARGEEPLPPVFKKDKSRTMAVIRARVVASLGRLGVAVPMTDPSAKFPEGQVGTDKETLELCEDDEVLQTLAEQMTFAKHLGQWEGPLRSAIVRPVCCRYTVLVKTGRTACSGSEGQEGTNIQNPPRKGDVRPCIIAPDGWVMGATDADTIELRAHAQNMLELVGWSRTADFLIDQHENGGPDLHEVLGAGILEISPREMQERVRAGDKEAEEIRQFAKIPGYGFPGGLGPDTFVSFAARQMKREAFRRIFGDTDAKRKGKARHLREVWFRTDPANREYFRIITEMLGGKRRGNVVQLMSRRIRGDVSFPAAANGFFQGRVADAEKECVVRLAYECYTGLCSTCWGVGGSPAGDCADCRGSGRSVLAGSRPTMFLHDEPILLHPEDGTESDRLERQRLVNEQCLNKWMPKVPCTSGGVLMRRWQKGAKTVKVDGKHVPVKPQPVLNAEGKVEKVIWVHDRKDAA